MAKEFNIAIKRGQKWELELDDTGELKKYTDTADIITDYADVLGEEEFEIIKYQDKSVVWTITDPT